MTGELKYIIKLFYAAFILMAPALLAQEGEPPVQQDTLVTEVDTVRTRIFQNNRSAPLISGIELGLDYLKFASLLFDFETKYEGNFGIVFKNQFRVSLEGGRGILNPERAYQNAFYESEGNYGRLGLDFIIPFDTINSIYMGVKYGLSQFSDQAIFEIENAFGFRETITYQRENLSANWYEIIFGSETTLRRNLFAGGILRLRILGRSDRFDPIDIHNIPGYGRVFDKTIPAFNLYVKYRIGF
ncbi:hypothetical protein BH23BAC1_BH23BAC1_36960 [soil metagenome]